MCLRLIAGIAAAHDGMNGWGSDASLAKTVIEIAAGLLLWAGLWTPIAGAALAVIAAWSAFSGIGDPWGKILLAVVGAALAMLGPGAWSIDARLFGRKRLITSGRHTLPSL